MRKHPVVSSLVAAVAVVGCTANAQELVSFPTDDGGVVFADVYGDGDDAVVLAHGGRYTKESWAEQAPVLADAGFRVVAIDFRGRGQSGGGSGSDNDVHLDVLAAVRWLRDRGATTVSVVGASFGGGAAARASVEADEGEIDRLVLLAHSSIDEPERMKGSKLFITARDDLYFGGTPRLGDIRDQFERAAGPKELVVLEGSAHAQFLFETEQADRLMEEILRFLSEPPTLSAESRSGAPSSGGAVDRDAATDRTAADSAAQDPAAAARAALIEELRSEGIRDERVLAVLGRVPRHLFVPEGNRELAYLNTALPIGYGQTISQPYVVALMSELLEPQPGDRVLEIGTGSGYQAAVLAELGCEVFSIELLGELADSASQRLQGMGYERIHVLHGDGYLGWPQEAPFDKVIVTAAPPEIPEALVDQLRPGGRMVVPVGPEGGIQQLTLLEKQEHGEVRIERIIPVRFVPMRR